MDEQLGLQSKLLDAKEEQLHAIGSTAEKSLNSSPATEIYKKCSDVANSAAAP